MFELARTQASTLPERVLPFPIQSLAKHNRKLAQVIENNHQRLESIANFCRVFGDRARSKPGKSRRGETGRHKCKDRFRIGLVAGEKIGGHAQAYCYYYPADVFLVHFLGVVGAGVAADQAACDHQDGLGPEDHFGEDEGDHGDAVDDADEQNFYSVHGVNIFHAEQSEQRENQNADAGAEIADVNRDQQLEEKTGNGERAGRFSGGGAAADPGADARSGEEEQSGGEEQPGNQMQESRLRRAEQDARADDAADDSGEEQQREQAARGGSEGVAVSDGAGDGAGKKCGGVGGVGRDGGHAAEKESGEGDEAAAAGYGVEQASEERGEEEEEWVRKVHARE